MKHGQEWVYQGVITVRMGCSCVIMKSPNKYTLKSISHASPVLTRVDSVLIYI